jgi:hypothetical protein
LALVTALVGAGVLVHKFVLSVETGEASIAKRQGFRSFAGHLIRHVLRFAVGAVVIAWMVAGLMWAVIG